CQTDQPPFLVARNGSHSAQHPYTLDGLEELKMRSSMRYANWRTRLNSFSGHAGMVSCALAGAVILLTAHGALSANSRSLGGVVQTGGTDSSQPLPNVQVALFEATTGQPTMLGQATTDGSGQFSIRYTRSTSRSIFFVKAEIGEGVQFITVLGPNLPTSVTLNELTTVAASYSMSQFLRSGVISGSSFGLQIAAGMNDNIATVSICKSSPVLLSSPNAAQTNSL